MTEHIFRMVGAMLGGISLSWLWRRRFGRAGKLAIVTVVCIQVGVSILHPVIGLSTALVEFGIAALNEVVRIATYSSYFKAIASFETNQIFRGISPTEAAYFIGLPDSAIVTTTLISLLDKGAVGLVSGNGIFQLSDQLIEDPAPTPEGRYRQRVQNSRQAGQILLRYENALLELFPSGMGIQPGELDTAVWILFLRSSIEKLLGTYDFDQTRGYAKKIVEKMTSKHDEYSHGQKNLSGWYSVRFFLHGEPEEDHRPEWLLPGDDFIHFVQALRDQMANPQPLSARSSPTAL